MRLLICTLLLIGCTSPQYQVTCYSAGHVVFNERLAFNRLSDCYEDEFGYCIHVPPDCFAKAVPK